MAILFPSRQYKEKTKDDLSEVEKDFIKTINNVEKKLKN